MSDHEWDADTDSIPGASDVEVEDVVEPTAEEIPVVLNHASGQLEGLLLIWMLSTSVKSSTCVPS